MNVTATAAVVSKPSSVEGWLRALEMTKTIASDPARLLPVVIDELADRLGSAPALLSGRERLSFRQLAERSNRYARWALQRGLRKGEVVGLLMPNRPEYLAVWLGIIRIGGVVALLNTGLRGGSLAHCINLVAPRQVIVAAELLDAFEGARPHLATAAEVWLHGAAPDSRWPRIDQEIDLLPGEPLDEAECRPLVLTDRALLIYTSGTTGLPKAAIVNHQRLLTWSFWFAGMMDTHPEDRMYNCLPMYHSVGGVVATGAVLVRGGAVVIAERFSARRFWDDVTRWDCTLFQYIGELCRYLVHAPPHPLERAHRLRLCCGNGLRANVWRAFEERFAIPRILEFYAATEGNVTLFNCEGKRGAIGRVPAFLAHRSPIALVRHDLATGEPLRDRLGRCERCQSDEAGEAIGRISVDAPDGRTGFDGYTDASATGRKILRDVFEAGDAWFRTGDLMRRDDAGYFYFVDRIGDTFRWKGENVSASEVTDTIAAFPGVTDVSVYGVVIPGADGRAGMASLVGLDQAQLPALRDHLIRHLPAYARPLFLRLAGAIETTGTFKHRTSDLVRTGYDPSGTTDPLYCDDPHRRAYVRLDRALHDRILGGCMRW